MFEIKIYHPKLATVNSGESSISYNLVADPQSKILDAPPVQFSSILCSFQEHLAITPLELAFSLGNSGVARKTFVIFFHYC